MSVDINDFERELECDYKSEHYSARDNGAIMRHPKEGKRPRKLDNLWTFGKPNDKNYLCISSDQVHRIVATAFHGAAPTAQHIVDHIDTNRHNNRPENLRWLTKLENILNNPITKSKIIYLCGSIEAFLADPSILPANDGDPNFGWMRRVTKEEGQNCLERMKIWARQERIRDIKPESQSTIADPIEADIIGEWVFRSPTPNNKSNYIKQEVTETDDEYKYKYTESLTPNAVQENWSTPSEFPLCPQIDCCNHIEEYYSQLKENVVFSKNDYGISTISKFAMSQDGKSILVLCNTASSIKPKALSEIRYEDGLYIHKNNGSYFSESGAEKGFTLACGLEWNGEDPIDDYC